ncbi:MAG TPA: quinol:cytochrome C oxidoreductase [Polyangia bacterium]|jgi:hypothetical protein|nr:quinol:cytochrome C oxidoreductase [Polyangia bacterium]
MNPPRSALVRNLLGAMTLIGAAGSAGVYFGVGRERFWVNWLVWTLFLLTLGLGNLFLVALERLVGAHWSVPMRRVPERLASLIPLAVPLLLIAFFGVPVIFPWTYPEAAHNPILVAKAPWLNLPFFAIRLAACVFAWMLFYAFYVRGSLRQDQNKDPDFTVRARKMAPFFMVVFFFSVTILAFDWISGLEPEWYSDMFGVYLFAGSFISGIAAMLLGVLSLKSRGRLPDVQTKHVYNLGSLGLAFTVFFAYIGFAQYMLIWYANLPEEVIWFKHRIDGAWQPVALLLPLLHFFIPFFLLIGSVGKKHPALLRLAALSILLGHFVDLYWLIFPVLGLRPLFGWPELAMACFFLALGFLQIRRAMGRGADMPVGDPLLAKGLEWQL